MAAYQHYRSPFGDTTFTKVFVGGLAWETQTEVMRRYFEQFGEILEAVIITDKTTGKSKGYGFVTFRDPDSARRACADPNPVIDGRRANCNIASLGRPRPSPPRGRNQDGAPHHGGAVPAVGASSSYSGVATPLLPPPPPPPVPVPAIYPPYGYATYPPDYGGYQQAVYNPQLHQLPQYYHQQAAYGASSSPYYYGYSMQGGGGGGGSSGRGAFSTPRPYYLYYHHHPPALQMESSSTFSPSYPSPRTSPLPSRLPFNNPSSSEGQTPQSPSTETEAGAATSSEAPPNT